jgi:proline iminopeptidase
MRGLSLGLALMLQILQAQDLDQRKIARDGFELHYRVYGSGAPVLILAGGPGFDCDYMEPVAREIAKNHRAILVELRGTGRSMPPVIDRATINLKQTLADLELVRAAIGVERWSLLGHSAGAVLAMTYATSYPEHVASLVLANSGPIRRESAAAEMDNLLVHLTPQEREEFSKVESQDFGKLFKYLLPGYFFDRVNSGAVAKLLGPEKFHAETANLLAADIFGGSGDLRPGLKDFSRPVFIIAGRQDPCDPAMQYEIHLALKNSTLQLLNRCGHFSWIEAPTEFYKALREFLAAHPKG